MIQANELRIGNTVTEYNLGLINADVLDLENIVNGDTNYKPILLTEEWLLKFGFGTPKDFDKGYWLETPVIGIEKAWLQPEVKMYLKYNNFNIELWDYHCQFKIECKHVHQLQNLYFALTNKELTLCQ